MKKSISYDTALAIVGMAGRFPGANTIHGFWQNLRTGTKSIQHFSEQELLAAGVDPEMLKLPNYVRAGAILEGAEYFDADFFGYTPREAELTDPQHRVFLECTYEALQDAAYDIETYPGLISVFGGSALSPYFVRGLTGNQPFDEANLVQISVGNERDSLASAISYKLNLRGPSLGIQTFCSTSLVAVHLACQSLLNYDCDIALAGGVAIAMPQINGYLYEEGGILSPDGECRTFDANGAGSVMGNGAAVVVLKRLEEAIEDGDQIYSVILGTHINNDGSRRVSYTAPGLEGQSAVIAQAISNAGVDIETISYIEAHGTATMLGDQIELAALKKAFALRTQKKHFCALGSLKPNVGHLDRASGVSGLIKTALALKHQELPPSLNFEKTSPDIDLANSPFYVNTSLADWQASPDNPRRAGVSSFGLGGTNAHVVIEEAPLLPASMPAQPWQLLVLSAKTATALDNVQQRLLHAIQTEPEANLANIAYTLQVGRTMFNHRRFLLCRDRADALTQLSTQSSTLPSLHQTVRNRALTLLFPATAHFEATSAQSWYQEDVLFRATVDGYYQRIHQLPDCAEYSFSSPQTRQEMAVAALVLACSQVQLLLKWGMTLTAVSGTAYGLDAAAALAGQLSLEDAVQLTITRAKIDAGALPAEALSALIQQLHWQTGDIPYLSQATGTTLSKQQEASAAVWLHDNQFASRLPGHLCQLLSGPENVLVTLGDDQLVAQIKSAPTYLPAYAERVIPWQSNTGPVGRAQLLNVLGYLWLSGVSIEWSQGYTDEQRRRVSLPTYPFEHKRFWIEDKALAAPQVHKKEPDLARWFYQPVWKPAALPATTASSPQRCLWVFEDLAGLGEQLAGRLNTMGQRVVRIQAGDTFIRVQPDLFQLRPGNAEDYKTLCKMLQKEQLIPETIFHLWSVSTQKLDSGLDTFQTLQVSGFHSLMALIQALNTILGNKQVRVLAVANGLYQVQQQDTLIPEKSTLIGACKVIPQENLGMRCHTIDVVLPEEPISPTTPVLAQLVQEYFADDSGNSPLAYRDLERLAQTYEPMTIPEAQQPPFRQGGVYLITGGLGSVGPLLAEHLGKTYQATVILLSRASLLPREQWQQWLDEHDENDDLSIKLKHLLAMEAGGGRFVLMQCDVGDVDQLRQILQQIHTRFGALHGVLHAAGVTNALSFKSTQTITPADYALQVRPKVDGLYALEKTLTEYPVDFCLLFSSISVVLGGITFSAYVAGNVFLDAFAQARQQTSTFPWLSIDWDTWKVKENMHGAIGATVAEYSMDPEEACAVLTRVLARRIPHVAISTGDLQARIDEWVNLASLLATDDADEQLAHKKGTEKAVPLSIKAYTQSMVEIWQQVLGLSEIGLYDNFFDLGGNSLIGLQVISKLKKTLNRSIPAVALYEAPTVSALAQYLLPAGNEDDVEEAPDLLKERRNQARQSTVQEEIAIIGMTGHFPGAPTVDAFWENLRNGVESINSFTEEELIEAGCDPLQVRNAAYVKMRPTLPTEAVENFDALFFGYSPREAELTDPQHRLFLESSWEALEVAGYDPSTYTGLIGVFGGSNISTYMMSMLNNPDAALGDDYQMVIGNDKDSLTTSVSYKLNLKGPSFAVQTFCSTSLVATHLACQSLLHGECDLALAGGVSIRVPMKAGHLYEEGGMESPDGHCRTFDAQAKGSMFGDGVGVVVLKRLSEAVADGDIIHAVIKGSAVNNDGSLKVSYTAPSIVGQSEVVTMALEAAGVSPESISYIEAHGTATELGDPIEVASLTKAYRAYTDQTGYCAIGSVKTNVGHLDRAAGVSGLIKTVLALKHHEIPANLHFQESNPEIDFEQSPFYVNKDLSSWETNGEPRRAGINSLGLGGTNAHVIVEEAPVRPASGPSRPWQLLMLSARTSGALAQSTQRLREHLLADSTVPLADVAYTLQVGRKLMDHRRVVLCRTTEEALKALDTPPGPQAQVFTGQESRTDRQVAFLLPGVGERYIDVTQALYHAEETFRSAIDTCHSFLNTNYGLDLHRILELDQMPTETRVEAATNGKLSMQSLLGRNGQATKSAEPTRTAEMQPTVFVVEYALAQLLLQWGISPQAMLGYSLGEYVVACLAGVLSLKDALRLVAGRAQLIEEIETGAMLAVMLSEAEIKPYLDAQINLAIHNSPTACVLAGPVTAIEQLATRLLKNDIACRRVETTHAFHSQMLSPLMDKVTELAGTVTLHTPTIPYISNVTGTWITDEQATDPGYWAQHMCQTVRFADGVGCLLTETDCLLLEVGPGQALSFFAKQHPACTPTRRDLVLPTLPAPHGKQKQDPHAFLLSTLGKLWLTGVVPDWTDYYRNEKRQRVILPTYPFERQRYWIDGGSSSARAIASNRQNQQQVLAPAAILSSLKKEKLDDWFYLPGWKHAGPQLPEVFAENPEQPICWLLLLDERGIVKQLATLLVARQHQVITVVPGAAFAQHSPTSFTVRPAERADYTRLLKKLEQPPQRIIHGWTITEPLTELSREIRLEHVMERGFYCLMALAQALGEVNLEDPCQIIAVSNELQDVTGQETTCPEKATIIGPSRIIAQEYPSLSCRSVDIAIPLQESQQRTLLKHLLGEVLTPTTEPVVALRRTGRWLLTFERLHIPPQPLQETSLREHGTYLITGGLGGIGLGMANYLARSVQANLVLISRSGLPDRAQWADILQEKGSEKGVGRQISQVLALEELGSTVLPLAADVSQVVQMEMVIQQTTQTFGALHGVIHAAGLPGVGLMQNKTAAQAASVMSPKLNGTIALDQALRACPLDFLVLFSSITSSTGGGPGQIDYCAANAFLDAYAIQHAHGNCRTIAINWGEWQWNAWEAGLSGYDEETQAFFRANRLAFGISFTEGAEALQRILSQPFSEVVVSTQDFGVLSQLSRTHTAATALEQFHQARSSLKRHERPPMGNEYTAPQTDLERTLTSIWEEILGIDGIGSKDNFFDLGGNSLVGIELITQVRKVLKMQTLPSYVLYEAPTVETMAAFLANEEAPVEEQQEQRQERSDKRRENLKLRMRERAAR
ncbi:hypothetical protein KDA_47820 [Dictyobacter alpinus]|uniref:Polyketide synthase n=1 Tax=Dictyobacter alpinus TaxID=2014873 RepID=A0A402BD26_9CHLR|nr:type I polyketide synthase [Dictyobacter alpinus]GCE29298.1 hypothetical protein KDA_47820 [Dictyobacter alpinus]